MIWLTLSAALAAPWPALDVAAPATGEGDADAALVVGVSDYAHLDDLPGASQTATDWTTWLVHTRGVPEERVRLLRDEEALRTDILDAARAVAGQVEAGGTLWVVLIGQGAQRGLALADAKAGSDGLTRDELADALRGDQERAVWVIDAAPTTPPALASLGAPAADLVFTAGSASQLAELNRPAFSTLVLGALRGWADSDADGAITASEVLAWTELALARAAPGQRQPPQLEGSLADQPLAQGSEIGPDLGIPRRPPPPATLGIPGKMIPGNGRDPWFIGMEGDAIANIASYYEDRCLAEVPRGKRAPAMQPCVDIRKWHKVTALVLSWGRVRTDAAGIRAVEGPCLSDLPLPPRRTRGPARLATDRGVEVGRTTREDAIRVYGDPTQSEDGAATWPGLTLEFEGPGPQATVRRIRIHE